MQQRNIYKLNEYLFLEKPHVELKYYGFTKDNATVKNDKSVRF